MYPIKKEKITAETVDEYLRKIGNDDKVTVHRTTNTITTSIIREWVGKNLPPVIMNDKEHNNSWMLLEVCCETNTVTLMDPKKHNYTNGKKVIEDISTQLITETNKYWKNIYCTELAHQEDDINDGVYITSKRSWCRPSG